jgi:hypothetical protein
MMERRSQSLIVIDDSSFVLWQDRAAATANSLYEGNSNEAGSDVDEFSAQRRSFR